MVQEWNNLSVNGPDRVIEHVREGQDRDEGWYRPRPEEDNPEDTFALDKGLVSHNGSEDPDDDL